ncbi:hypothetical protein B4100_0264 [Heyndrickxia coagulans]|nr:hypothetical protein B4100_0264 [Heyndrickxia coagulans]
MLYFIAGGRILENKFFKIRGRLPHVPERVFSTVKSIFPHAKKHPRTTQAMPKPMEWHSMQPV